MGYSLCIMADFQNGLIFRTFSDLGGGFFAQKNAICFIKYRFSFILHTIRSLDMYKQKRRSLNFCCHYNIPPSILGANQYK